jgi:hypothetical protein
MLWTEWSGMENRRGEMSIRESNTAPGLLMMPPSPDQEA